MHDQFGTEFIRRFFVSADELLQEFKSKDGRTVQSFAEKYEVGKATINKRPYYVKRLWLRAMLIDAGENPDLYDLE